MYCGNNPVSFADPGGLAPMGPPPIPVPGGVPGNGWKWNPDPRNKRGGSWGPRIPVPGQSQPSASWEPEQGHWDVDNGLGQRERYTRDGKPISPDYAHGRGKRHYRNGFGRWASRVGKILKVVALVAFLDTAFRDGVEAALREQVFADEIEGGCGIIREAGERRLREAQEGAGAWYRRRGGFSDEELEEYGLAY